MFLIDLLEPAVLSQVGGMFVDGRQCPAADFECSPGAAAGTQRHSEGGLQRQDCIGRYLVTALMVWEAGRIRPR
jgi:hypothetical protein